MSLWNLLEQTARRSPNQPATSLWDHELTYQGLFDRVVLLAQELAARGVGAGDRVAILSNNGLPFLEAYFAAAGLGAILVPLGIRLAPRELEHLLEHAQAKWLLADTHHRELAAKLRLKSPTRAAALLGDGFPRLAPLSGAEPLVKPTSTFEPYPAAPRDVAQIYYTSGTTGDPKGVMLTHGNVTQHALWAIEEFQLAASDTWGHIAPMFHLADAWATFAITAVGARHAFLPQFEANAALRLLQTARITLTNLVPTMLQRILALEPPPRHSDFALRLILSGGAPIAPAVVGQILGFFGCDYAQTYGLTETSPYLTVSLPKRGEAPFAPAERLERISRTGRPFGGVKLLLVADNGEPVPKDDKSVGEIWAQAPTITPGYWNHPAATQEAFSGVWFRTGDLATWDDRDSLCIVDRRKDMILSGGENVYSTEVEAVLLGFPGILEAAVFGVPSEEWGEEVHAAIVWRNGVHGSLPDLGQHLRSQLAAFKNPKRIVVLDDLPKTSSGKIKKRALRDAYGA